MIQVEAEGLRVTVQRHGVAAMVRFHAGIQAALVCSCLLVMAWILIPDAWCSQTLGSNLTPESAPPAFYQFSEPLNAFEIGINKSILGFQIHFTF